jgi:hypothetical protein
MRKTAEVLEKYGQRMIPDYAKKSGKSEDEIRSIMAEETWYAGQEIVDAGFADEVTESMDIEPVVAGLRNIAKNAPAGLVAVAERQAAERSAAFPRRMAAKHKRTWSVAEAKEYSKRLDVLKNPN